MTDQEEGEEVEITDEEEGLGDASQEEEEGEEVEETEEEEGLGEASQEEEEVEVRMRKRSGRCLPGGRGRRRGRRNGGRRGSGRSLQEEEEVEVTDEEEGLGDASQEEEEVEVTDEEEGLGDASQEEEEEEEEEEVFEFEYKGVMYFATDEVNGVLYACVDNDIGDEVGKIENKNVILY